MDFKFLQSRLLANLRTRLRNGEITERRLARLTGISQPHIHNVLKGARILTPKMGDRLLRRLNISLADLLPGERVAAAFCPGCAGPGVYREVPVLEGWLGPGLPLPRIPSRVERYPFPASYLASLERPRVARLAGDIRMAGAVLENDLVLLDESHYSRSTLTYDALYVVNRDGEGLIRHVRLQKDLLYLITRDSLDQSSQWEGIRLGRGHVLDVVRAKVIWIGRQVGGR